MSSASRIFNTRITKWGELPEDRKNEAMLTMAEQILVEVGDNKATEMSSSEVKNICGNVFKHFLPSGNWKGNVPNGVLKELREQIDSSTDEPFVNLRNLDDYEDAAHDWFGVKAETSARKPASGLKIKVPPLGKHDSIVELPTPKVRDLANSGMRLALMAVNTAKKEIEDEEDAFEQKIEPLKAAHKERMKILKSNLNSANEKLSRAKAAAVEVSMRDATSSMKRSREAKEPEAGGTLPAEDILGGLDDDDDDDDDASPPTKKKVPDSTTVLKNLPQKFVNYLRKNGAINSDYDILKQIDMPESDVEKVRQLGVTESILKDLENKFKVISTPSL